MSILKTRLIRPVRTGTVACRSKHPDSDVVHKL
jgi:hypothetical protein